MEIQSAIKAVIARQDLSGEEMNSIMQQIMTGECTPSQVGGFLVGLRMKGETVDEIAAAAQVMRELATRVEVSGEHLVDTAGTGGDASGSFNISTASAIVAAGAGAMVAKHGKALLGKLAADDKLASLKAVNFALKLQRMAQVSLQPLIEAMVVDKNAAVRYFGWRAYATLRGPILASGGDGAKAMYAALAKAPAVESDAYVLSELFTVCRMPAKPDPGSGVGDAAHSAAQVEFLKALSQNWTGLGQIG